MPEEITENTGINLKIGVWVTIAIALLVFATSAGAFYQEHKDLPDKVRRLEKRSLSECYTIKNMQDHLLKADERYPLKCSEE